MVLDRIIRGGTIVDGTGSPAYSGDVGIRDGKIVALGKVEESAHDTVDARGKVVSPGFIDMHTHLDAQIMWDPGLSPTSLHGVTTIVGGNCGFAIAPITDATSDYIINMLANVEQMPIETLQIALNPNWTSWAEWISQIQGKSALNFGFHAGHSTIRRLVMGEDWQRPATDVEIDKMAEHLDETLRAGALGFSSSWNDIHNDHAGTPVPSRFAEPDELVRLSAVLRRHPGTILGFQAGSTRLFPEVSVTTMAEMSEAAGTRLNWNALTVGLGVDEEAIRERLKSSDYAANHGGEVYALLNPNVRGSRQRPLSTLAYNTFPEWARVMSLPREERLKAFADPEVRRRLAEPLDGRNSLRRGQDVEQMVVETVLSPELRPLLGRSLPEIAQERGCTALDVWFDIAIADNLDCYFYSPVEDVEGKWRLLAELLQDTGRTVVGGSDAGAHVDQLDSFNIYTTHVGPTVRDHDFLTLEQAVHQLTDAVARFNNIKGRGRLAEGWQADVVVFDPETVGPGQTEMRPDLPGGIRRMYSDPTGIERVVVNGVDVVVDGAVTGSTPGDFLRSGVEQEVRAYS